MWLTRSSSLDGSVSPTGMGPVRASVNPEIPRRVTSTPGGKARLAGPQKDNNADKMCVQWRLIRRESEGHTGPYKGHR